MTATPVHRSASRVFGDGTLARLIRDKDWRESSLGPIEGWPETLVAAVNAMLQSPFASAVYWGKEMTLLYNDAFLPTLHANHPAVLGGYGPEIWAETWPDACLAIRAALDEGRPTLFTDRYFPVAINGVLEDRWWTFAAYPIVDGDQVAGVANSVIDTTQSIVSRRALEAAEARSNRVFESIGDAVIVMDADTRVTRMNPVAEALTGWGKDEALDRPLAEVFRIRNETTREMVENPADKVIRLGGVVGLANHTMLIRRDGSEISIDDSGAPILDHEGRLQGIVLVFRDIEDRRAAEREKERVSIQLNEILAATSDGIALLDRDWRFVFLNERGAEILHVEQDVLGRNAWEAFPAMIYDGSPYVEHYHRAMNDGIPGDFVTEYPEPLNITVHIFVRPVERGLLVIFRDITEDKRRAASLMQTEKLAAVGRMASSIAHEINNPLESVTNLLYLARTSRELPDIEEYLELAERELRRVSIITAQTLRFHKASTRPVEAFCYDLIGDSLSMFQGRLVNSRISVEKKKRAEHPVQCFSGEIRQVLTNLVWNAIDSMPTGGRLLLRSREAMSWKTGVRGLVITVADTGTGMPPQVLHKIFDAFYTTKGIGGTGLGLWVSAEIVQRHRGSLRVRSSQREGRSGTVFTLHLPFETVERGGSPEGVLDGPESSAT